LALEGYELLTVVAILVILFIWGPQKLPEMARSIGLAKKEFEKAAKEVSTGTASVSATTQPKTETAPQDPLLVAAKSLGIVTEGKTKGELAKEIAERASN
jgi:sec-independent protein translocase protein TatA